jgi:hypothetical protein
VVTSCHHSSNVGVVVFSEISYIDTT